MVDNKKLATLIARDIFKLFDQGKDKCQRIEGKGGRYPDAETTLAGLGEQPLAEVIQTSLDDHRSY